MKAKFLIISLMVSMYNYAQTAAKPDRLVISVWKNVGYNDIILNTLPPPAEKLNININSSITDKGFISIYDLNGKLIKQEEITIENGENNYAVNVQNLSSDIYTVKISGSLFNTSKKIALN